MNNLPLISVIVPVYNVEQYLKPCIESIVNQDYKNLEIILVDDGSTDNSGNICDEFAKTDNRIKVIHQENGGLAAARNSGLKVAAGLYLAFIDGDDFWDKDCVSFLYNLLIKNKAQLAECAVRHLGFPGVKDNEIFADTPVVCSGESLTANILLSFNGFSASSCHMLIESSVCKNCYFIDNRFEDLEFMTRISFNIKKAIASKIRKYNYVYRPNNSSSTPAGIRKSQLDLLITEIGKTLKNENVSEYLWSCLDNRYISNGIYILQTLPKKEKYLFNQIRADILKHKFNKKLLTKSSYLLFKALQYGKMLFYIADWLFIIYKKLKCLVK